MKRAAYIHPGQEAAYERYCAGAALQEEVEAVYREIDFRLRKPDFLGKTVRVSERQFPKVHRMLCDLAKEAGIPSPAVYVYEDYYYGAESGGVGEFWIELSAKTVQDFTEDELRFVLAREIYKISDGVTRQRTIMEARLGMLRAAAPDQLEKASKLSFYRWYRLTGYSADCYGYLMCGGVESAVRAILKLVLNSAVLAEQVDLGEFIRQAAEINRLDDMVSNYTKADESVPYAPHRLQNLLAYAVSERGLTAREERMAKC